MITTRLDGNTAVSDSLKGLIASLKNSRQFFKVWADRASEMARNSARSHSKGGFFWKGIADQTRVMSADDSGAVVQCLHFAGAQKEFGGTIRAKTAKFLTIPIKGSKAVGMRAGEFENTFVMGGIIFQGVEHGKRKGGKAIPLFILKKSVTQNAEPWWPQAGPVLDEGLKLASQQLDREIKI
jgi:hypothetical protein